MTDSFFFFFALLFILLIADLQQDRSSSPPPPLPERTRESFFLADEDCKWQYCLSKKL